MNKKVVTLNKSNYYDIVGYNSVNLIIIDNMAVYKLHVIKHSLWFT